MVVFDENVFDGFFSKWILFDCKFQIKESQLNLNKFLFED